MNGGPPEAWQNSWVYPAGYEDQAELKVSVNLEPGLPLRNVGGQPNPVFFSVKLSEKGKSVGIPAFVVNEGGIPESIARSYRYQRNIWPPRPHHGALNIIASLSRRGLSQRSPSLLITSQPKPSNAFDPFESADSLVLSSSNVTLMLYAVHIIGGPTIGYCVRYLRHGEDGGVVADVMLRPAMTRIR
jgi:hypothetical protein